MTETLINSLLPEKEVTQIEESLDKNSLSEHIMDLSLPLEHLIKYIEQFYKDFGQLETVELINRLSIMYEISGTKILEKYLYKICTKETQLHTFLKITAANSLCYFNQKQIIGYQALNSICETTEFDKEISTPIKIDCICSLMSYPSFKKEARDYFCEIVNNNVLDCDYRYKTILSLENKNIIEKNFFIKEAAFEFFKNINNQTLYRILAGQLILQKYNPTTNEIKIIETTLLSFAQDILLDYNLRADSADVILKLGSPSNKIIAKEIILLLGSFNNIRPKTIFENAQNVHTNDIEESVIKAIEFLSTIDTQTISNIPGSPYITFEYVKKEILNILKGQSKTKKDAIKISLNRIYLDSALYSKFNYTLSNIFIKVWTYICSHKSETEMKKRLLEELVEMSGTCSSGFAGRLVNSISGFGDFNLSISWKDQIIANFTGILNAKARNITNETKNDIEKNSKLYELKEYSFEELCSFQEKVLEELTLKTDDYQSRSNYLKFFRKNMLDIKQELYSEFKQYITDSEFDFYFRCAISVYETGEYV